MDGFQPIPLQIDAQAFSASGQVVTKLDKLMVELDRKHLHLIGFLLDFNALTCTTSSGSVKPTEMDLLFQRIEFNDGRQARFVGSGADLAQFERYEAGGRVFAEPATSATTVLWNKRRFLSVGPIRMAGSPTDFAIPNAALMKGFVSVRFNTLTGITANLTALTGTYTLTAVCVGMDELRIPPFIERKVVAVSSDDQIPGACKVPFLFYGNSSSWDAFAAGDIGTVTVRTGRGEIVSAVNAQGLTAMYNQDFRMGELGGLIGDPGGAGDLAAREVNPGTVTALQSSSPVIQPVLYVAPDGRLSKIAAVVENTLGVKYSGNNTGTVLGITRVLPQSPAVLDSIAREIQNKVGVPLDLKLKLRMGGKFNQADAPYMPYALKPKRAA